MRRYQTIALPVAFLVIITGLLSGLLTFQGEWKNWLYAIAIYAVIQQGACIILWRKLGQSKSFNAWCEEKVPI